MKLKYFKICTLMSMILKMLSIWLPSANCTVNRISSCTAMLHFTFYRCKKYDCLFLFARTHFHSNFTQVRCRNEMQCNWCKLGYEEVLFFSLFQSMCMYINFCIHCTLDANTFVTSSLRTSPTTETF